MQSRVHTFEVGDAVECKYQAARGGKKWYKGKIARVNSDGSFDVTYDDGDSERHVSTVSYTHLTLPTNREV